MEDERRWWITGGGAGFAVTAGVWETRVLQVVKLGLVTALRGQIREDEEVRVVQGTVMRAGVARKGSGMWSGSERP